MSLNILDVINVKKNKISNQKKEIERIKNIKIKCEAQLEQLNENEKELINEIHQAGFDSNNLSEIIDNKLKELEVIEKEIDSILNE